MFYGILVIAGGVKMIPTKNKEVLIGLIIIVILSIIAVFLLIRKEIRQNDSDRETVTEQTTIQESSSTEERITQTEESVEETVSTVQEKEEQSSDSITELETYVKKTRIDSNGHEGKLNELYTSWKAYDLKAVDDLLHLEEFQTISSELKGTDQFYYYGDVNPEGNPEGYGLAVYSDNTYYCGEWKNGLREGNGMWQRIYIYKDKVAYPTRAVLAHTYNGEWSQDLPEGSGQEHYDYTISELKEDKIYFANVIGSFHEGYYNGDMYIMIMETDGTMSEWEGKASYGVWGSYGNAGVNGDYPLWKKRNEDDNYKWFYTEQNQSFGISGLKK